MWHRRWYQTLMLVIHFLLFNILSISLLATVSSLPSVLSVNRQESALLTNLVSRTFEMETSVEENILEMDQDLANFENERSRSQVAERVEHRASNLNVATSIPGRCTWRCVLGQGTPPYLPRGECLCIYWKSLWIRVSKWLNVKRRS